MFKAIQERKNRQKEEIDKIKELFDDCGLGMSTRNLQGDEYMIRQILYILSEEIPKPKGDPLPVGMIAPPNMPMPAVKMPLLDTSIKPMRKAWYTSWIAWTAITSAIVALPVLIELLKWISLHVHIS